jgi:hypothetical protein
MTATELTSKAYFIKPSISLCVCMCIPPIVTRQRLDKTFTATTNTLAIEEFGGASFSTYGLCRLIHHRSFILSYIPANQLRNLILHSFKFEVHIFPIQISLEFLSIWSCACNSKLISPILYCVARAVALNLDMREWKRVLQSGVRFLIHHWPWCPFTVGTAYFYEIYHIIGIV